MNIVIFGALSGIAQSLAEIHAKRGDTLMLFARDLPKLTQLSSHLKVLGAQNCFVEHFDALNTDPQRSEAQIKSHFSKIDVMYFAHGVLTPQQELFAQPRLTQELITVNYTSHAILGNYFAQTMRNQEQGKIVFLCSVAGDRGKQSNLTYSSSFAGRNTFADGLRHALRGSNVKVFTLKIGFVDSPMTRDFKKGFLWISSSKAARLIDRAVTQNQETGYFPGIWFWIMLIIRNIPESIFLRTKL